ncbi:MAG: phosphopantetheine-binding protein [Pseudonocardiales bacterium]
MSDVADRVLVLVSSIAGQRSVDVTAQWRALGMDSLDLLSLVITVEDEFGIAIPDPVAMTLHCAADVIALLTDRR